MFFESLPRHHLGRTFEKRKSTKTLFTRFGCGCRHFVKIHRRRGLGRTFEKRKSTKTLFTRFGCGCRHFVKIHRRRGRADRPSLATQRFSRRPVAPPLVAESFQSPQRALTAYSVTARADTRCVRCSAARRRLACVSWPSL